MPHVEHVTLDDAATLRLSITADGVLIEDLVIAPGWRIRIQQPKPGLLRRTPKPAAYAILVLERDSEDGPDERELEVNRLPDGTWEHAVLRRGPMAAGWPVICPGGRVDVTVEGGRVVVEGTDPSPGWTVRSMEATEDDVVVVFACPSEEWEVVVLAEDGDSAILELDHRRQLGVIA